MTFEFNRDRSTYHYRFHCLSPGGLNITIGILLASLSKYIAMIFTNVTYVYFIIPLEVTIQQ